MRILQINSVYAKGSTGKIVKDIHSYLMGRDYDSFVCFGRGQASTDSRVIKTCGEGYSKLNNAFSRINGLEYGNCHISTKRLIFEIEKIQPDVVHLHCLNGYYVNVFQLIEYLKKKHIPTILTLHAEFMYTGNCGHAFECEKWKTGCGACPNLRGATKSLFVDRTAKSWKMMRDAFRGYENLIVASVSPWLKERAALSPILADKEHVVVLNGLDSDLFTYQKSSIREELGINSDEKMIFHATPTFSLSPTHIKGGIHVYNLAKKLADTGVKVVVAGEHGDIPRLDNLILLGKITDQQELAKLYSAADLTLLTSRKETFSMVCAESLCCGTPVVGYKAGAPEQISLPEYSKFVENGDIEALYSAVVEMIESDHDKAGICETAGQVYSAETMARNYVDLYKRVGAL